MSERLESCRILPYGKGPVRAAFAAAAILAAASTLGAATLGTPWALAVLPPAAALPAFTIAFFRNPRRAIPRGPGLAVAPADGRVAGVDTCREDAFLGRPARRIGIFMSLWDVHANRAPCDGRVAFTDRRPGRFHNALFHRASSENEANLIGLVRPDGGRVLIKQIAGVIARRIVCRVGPGDAVARGELIGMIKFGSRTELYVPDEDRFEVRVRPGQRVKAGETVLGVWR